MRYLLICVAMVVAVLFTAVETRAATIFQEDWNSGISAAKWNTFAAGGGPFTFDLGLTGQGASGDSALFLRDASFSYNAGVRSVPTFSRTAGAQGVKTSFKLFRDTAGLFDFTSVGGPWANLGAPSGTLSFLEDLEAAISTAQPATQLAYYVEDAPGVNDWALVPTSSAFSAAFAAATTKATALDVSVTVGNSIGAKLEWSTGGGPTTVEFDTINDPNGAGFNWAGGNTVSSTDPLWLSFGGVGNGSSHASAIIDDIVVTTIPEPASGLLLTLALGTLAAFRPRRT